jgi:outer membrane protein OmpA-like peptidoglycan-associated protein
VALGADHDTLKFIIGSPFDNWYVTFSAGIQTFISNTPDPDAYWNKVDYGIRADIGKWLIPDVAVLLRLGLATAHSQSRFGGNNPWSDVSRPINYNGAEYGPYYPINAYHFSALGLVALDWTNLFYGYETGRRKRLHFYSQAGMGGIVMFGKIINPNYVNKVNSKPDEKHVTLGDWARNLELGFMGGFTTEYYFTKKNSLYATLDLVFARGSLDDYNYNLDAKYRRIDLIPSFYVGAKIDILHHITKRHPEDGTNTYDTVYHEWLAFGSSHTVERLENKIEHISHERDSIRDLADKLADDDTRKLDSLDDLLNKLNNDLDLAKKTAPPMEFVEPDSDWTPKNIFDELMQVNRVLNLPATIVYYELDKYYLDYNARVRLQEFAHDASVLDDTIEFYIIGAADSLTGSIKHNQWLSERRSEAALNFLTKNLGMSRNQFVRVSAGGIMEYKIKEQNRMAMVIQKTPITEEIVDRWLRRARERLRNADR